MNVIRKDATITNTDEDFPGAFEVVLSTSAKDRDGDELAAEDWKQPLPEHITFDSDHGMSVASTVGSGVPQIDEQGRLVVAGSYSSLPRAQEVRTLVNEGHIRTTSVAFISEKVTKDGKARTVRELLNGAFVAIPSNREAVVLSAKAGARNSAADMARVQAIHDHALALGAVPSDAMDMGGKAMMPAPMPMEDCGALAQAIDAALDEAQTLLASVDPATLPAEVQQAIALLTAAEETVDELLDMLGTPDPDEPTEESAPAAAEKAAPAADTDALDLQNRLTVITAVASLAG